MAFLTTDAYDTAQSEANAKPVARVILDIHRDGPALHLVNRVPSTPFPAAAQQWGAPDGYACPLVFLTGPLLTLSWDATTTEPGGFGLLDLEYPLAPGKAYGCQITVTVAAGAPPVRFGDLNGDDWVESTAEGTPEVLNVEVTASAQTVIGVFTGADPGPGDVEIGLPTIVGSDDHDDITHLVRSVSVRQEITTDLPPEARLIAGDSVASATIVLGGNPRDNAQSAAWLWSPYNPSSPYHGSRINRRGIPVTIDMGYATRHDGDITYPVITGVTDNIEVDGPAGTVTLTVVDLIGAMTARPRLPTIVGLDTNLLALQAGNLNTQWPLAELVSQDGWHAVPPPRPGCVLYASMLGSLGARSGLGELTTSVYQHDADGDGTPDDAVGTALPYAQDPDGYGLIPAPAAGTYYQATYTLAGEGIRQRSGDSWLLQTWITVPDAPNGWGLPELALGVASTDGLWAVQLELQVTGGVGAVQLRVTRGGVDTIVTPVVGQALAPGRYYTAVYGHHDDDTSVDTVWRVGDDTATSSVGSITSAAAAPAMTVGAVQGSTGSSAVQVTAEHNGPNAEPHVRWDNAFTPAAYLDPGMAELTAIPAFTETYSGALARAIVAAEYGTLTIGARQDPDSGEIQRRVLTFRNRRHWYTSAEAGTVTRTLTANRSILTLRTSEPTDALRNVIRVPYRPLYVLPAGRIWQLTGQPISVPAHGTITVIATYGPDQQAYQVDTTGSVMPGGGITAASGSAYRAARNADGSGGELRNLMMTVDPLAGGAVIHVTNPNSFTVWLVSPKNSGYPPSSDGHVALGLAGRMITATAPGLDTSVQDPTQQSTPVIEGTSANSVTVHGEYEFVVPESVWRQRDEDARTLASDLLRAMAYPAPTVELDIVADPSVQPGDRVTIQDPERTDSPHAMRIDDPFWFVGLTSSWSSDRATTRVVLRPVARPGQLIWGVPGHSTWGVNTW